MNLAFPEFAEWRRLHESDEIARRVGIALEVRDAVARFRSGMPLAFQLDWDWGRPLR